MDDGTIEQAGSTAMLRRLRGLIHLSAAEPAPGWRDDLRLFAIAWAAGFIFFLLLIA